MFVLESFWRGVDYIVVSYCYYGLRLWQTCLSEGKGYYFPPCHILDVCGFRVLFDCPVDLSSLAVFSPVPIDYVANDENLCYSRKEDLGASSLICAEPRYRTVRNLLLWNVSFIDLVLISSPVGMLGLPFLTQNRDFSAKVIEIISCFWFSCHFVINWNLWI